MLLPRRKQCLSELARKYAPAVILLALFVAMAVSLGQGIDKQIEVDRQTYARTP